MGVSDQQLVKHLETLLLRPDFKLTTVEDVVRRLESQLGISLSHRTSFVGEQACIILASAYPIYPIDHFTPGQKCHSRGKIKGSELPKRNQIVNPTRQMVSGAKADLQNPEMKGSDVAKRYHFVSPNPQMGFKVEADPQDAEIKGSDGTKSVPAKKRGRAGGLNQVCGVTSELQVIVGQPALPRTEIVRQLWAYIRRNNLQDPSNKRKIICDDALRAVLETDCTDIFQMNKLLSKHIIRLEPPKQDKESNQAKKLKVGSVDGGSPSGNGEPGPQKWMMTEALAHFYGTGEREVLKTEVLERIWDYTMVNKLEDPVNKNVILCDAKLQHLFGCESIFTGDVPGMIDNHLFKRF